MFGLLDVGKVMYKGSGEKKRKHPCCKQKCFTYEEYYVYVFLIYCCPVKLKRA